MIKAEKLIQKFQYAFDQDWGYIYGTAGIIWTQAKQDAATREQTVKWGQRWVGKYVADCSGLFVWAFKGLNSSIYHGSNTIYNKYCLSKGKLTNGQRSDGKPILPGTAVFLVKDNNRHHIGLYIGNNTVIEAKGTYYGIVKSQLIHWDEWGELKDVEYPGGRTNMTIRKGDRGPEVRTAQELLCAAGFGISIDGVFGGETETAVKAFQRSRGLGVDGVIGPETWSALERSSNPSQDPLQDQTAKLLDELGALLKQAVDVVVQLRSTL